MGIIDDLAKKVNDNIVKPVQQVANDVVTEVTHTAQDAWNWVEGTIEDAKSGINDAISSALDTVDAISNMFITPDEVLFDVPAQLVEVMVDGIQDMVNDMTSSAPLSETELEELLRNTDEVMDDLEAILASTADVSEELRQSIVEEAKQYIQDLDDASDEDLAEKTLSILVKLAQAGLEISPAIAEILGPRAMQLMQGKISAPDIAQEIVKLMLKKYASKSDEKTLLGPVLSVALLGVDQQDREALINALAVAAVAAGIRQQGALVAIDALSSALNLPIGSTSTVMIEGQPFRITNIGTWSIAISLVPVKGYDVRVFKNKDGVAKVGQDMAAHLPKKSKVRKVLSVLLNAYGNYERTQSTVAQLEANAEYADILPFLREYLRRLISEAQPAGTPDQDQNVVFEEEVEGTPGDETFLLSHYGVGSRRKADAPEHTEQSTSAFQRAQASRATRLPADSARRQA